MQHFASIKEIVKFDDGQVLAFTVSSRYFIPKLGMYEQALVIDRSDVVHKRFLPRLRRSSCLLVKINGSLA